jgi:hypothetical protein
VVVESSSFLVQAPVRLVGRQIEQSPWWKSDVYLAVVAVAIPEGCCGFSTCDDVGSPTGVQGPIGAAALGASMVGGSNGHCGPAMETTLVGRAHGGSCLLVGGRVGTMLISNVEFILARFIFGGQRGSS